MNKKYLKHLIKTLSEDNTPMMKDIFQWGADTTNGNGSGEDLYFGDIKLSPGKEHFLSAREIKKSFNKWANHKWLSTLNTVHWGDDYDIENLLNTWNGKDEISTTPSLPGQPIDSSALFYNARTTLGVLIKGRITFATNDMDQAYTSSNSMWKNIRRSKDETERAPGSGINKLPGWRPSKKFLKAWKDEPIYILDADDWDPLHLSAGSNAEALVDNWKPVAIVLPERAAPILRDTAKHLSEKHGLPLIDVSKKSV
jgi:hypothetical protein